MKVSKDEKTEITIGISQAYRIAFAMLLPMLALFLVPYVLLWRNEVFSFFGNVLDTIQSDWKTLVFYLDLIKNITLFVLIVIGGAVLHEILHGITWVIYLRKGFKVLKFGFAGVEMAPYVHCKEPLPVRIYRFGIFLPVLVLGLIPLLAGILSENGFIFLLGLFFTWAASGDMIILWLIRRLDKNITVRDHPEKVGCFVAGSAG